MARPNQIVTDSPTSNKYVFKLKYTNKQSLSSDSLSTNGGTDKPAAHHRRYGFAGELDQAAVFQGLYDRASQAFSLPLAEFTITYIEEKTTLSPQPFAEEKKRGLRRYVVARVEDGIKESRVRRDEKGRFVLVFQVERIIIGEQPQSSTSNQEQQQQQPSPSKTEEVVQTKEARQHLITMPPTIPRTPLHCLIPTAATSMTPILPEENKNSQKVDQLSTESPAEAETLVESVGSQTSKSTVAASDHKLKRPCSTSRTSGATCSGLSYATNNSVATSERSSTAVTAEVDPTHCEKKRVDQISSDLPPITMDAWTGVKTLLKTFVQDLNCHLADNFGDEAAGFSLRMSGSPKSEDRQSPDRTSVAATTSTCKLANHKDKKEYHRGCLSGNASHNSGSVHKGCWCDHCLKVIVGTRYRCEGCTNFDLCQNCSQLRFGEDDEHVHHTFAVIAEPGQAPAYYLTPVNSPASNQSSDISDREKQKEVLPMVQPAGQGTQTQKCGASAKKVVHSATCDVCNKTIRGIRHKCLQCPDYDMCDTCFLSSVESLHPSHNFVAVHDPKQLYFSRRRRCGAGLDLDDALSHNAVKDVVVHPFVSCDGCGQLPLVGIRYKCVHPDCAPKGGFDLCESCDADPIARHSVDHPLLKMRKPSNSRHRSLVVGGMEEGNVSGVATETAVAQSTPDGPHEVPVVVTSSSDASGFEINPSLPCHSPPIDFSGFTRTLFNTLGINAPGLHQGEAEETTTTTTANVAEKGVKEQKEMTTGNEEGTPQMTERDMGLDTATPSRVVAALVSKGSNDENSQEEESANESHITVTAENSQSPTLPVTAATTFTTTTSTSATPTLPVLATFGATFVSDITLADGSIVPAGGEFAKIWQVKNSGEQAWPIGTRLVNVGGFSKKVLGGGGAGNGGGLAKRSFEVPHAEKGDVIEIQCELKAPEDNGRFMDHWRLQGPNGELFGDRFWVDITVQSEGDTALQSSDSSLSSSIVTPSLTAAGQVDGASSRAASVGGEPVSVSEEEEDEDKEASSNTGIVMGGVGARSESGISSPQASSLIDGEDDDEEDGDVFQEGGLPLSDMGDDYVLLTGSEADGEETDEDEAWSNVETS